LRGKFKRSTTLRCLNHLIVHWLTHHEIVNNTVLRQLVEFVRTELSRLETQLETSLSIWSLLIILHIGRHQGLSYSNFRVINLVALFFLPAPLNSSSKPPVSTF
jgi:hypothetical protein